jgi:hypothetical protein
LGKKTGNTRVVNGKTEYEWEQKDGLEWRNERGQVTEMSEAFKERTQLTPERGRELATAQWAAYREEAVEGLRKKMENRRGIPIEGGPEAYGMLVGTQAEIADSPELGMAAVKSFQNVKGALGLEDKVQQSVQAIQVNINISDNATDGFDADVDFLEAEFKEDV